MKILVSGATSGIGQGVCLELLSQGHLVYGLGRDPSKVRGLQETYPNSFFFLPIDLAITQDIPSLFDKILLIGGKLNGLVHCAGVEETIPLIQSDPKKIMEIFSVNVFSGIELLRIFSKKKYSENKSSVVLLSSVMGTLGEVGKVGYCASKSAILGVVRASALELAKRQIRVNAVSPGVVDTPMTQRLFETITEENRREITAMHPLGLGQIDSVVPQICFLLSEQAQWITGQNFIIDGGYAIR